MTEVYVNNRPKENVHDYPRPPALEVVPLRLRVIWTSNEGVETVIADTEKGDGKTYAYRVLETTHPPTYYISPEAVDTSLFTKTSRSSYCEWKGVASYFNFKPPGSSSVIKERIWSYPSPTKGTKFAPIAGYLSFYASPGPSKDGTWRCLVEGEQADTQESLFYGGWVTSEIQGEMKGKKGTEFW